MYEIQDQNVFPYLNDKQLHNPGKQEEQNDLHPFRGCFIF